MKAEEKVILKLLRRGSSFLARLPGLPVLAAIALVLANLVLQLLPDQRIVTWLAETHLFLHLGLVIGFLGILLGDAL